MAYAVLKQMRYLRSVFSYLGTDLQYASLEMINRGSVVSKYESDKKGYSLLANHWLKRVYLADVIIWVS